MPSALEWYVLFVVMTFVALFVVAHYVQWTGSGAIETQWNTPVGWLLAAATVGIFVVGVIAVFGSTVPIPARQEWLSYAIHTGPLVGGCLALAVAAGHSRLVLLFRRSERTQTTAVSDSESGTTVIVTGDVEATTHAISPALSQPAVCWSWTFEIRGTPEQEFSLQPNSLQAGEPKWIPRKADSGGVPFDLDDGSGPVRIDPTAATLTVPMTNEHVCPADGPQPGRVGANLHQSVGGDTYRYREAVADDGDELTILGTVTDDGLDATRIYHPRTAATACQRYTHRALVAAVGGTVGIVAGIWLTARLFAVPLPV